MDISVSPREFTIKLDQEDLIPAVSGGVTGVQSGIRFPVCSLVFPNQSLTAPLSDNIQSGDMGDLTLSISKLSVQGYPILNSSVGNNASINHKLFIEEVQSPDPNTGEFTPCSLDVLGDGVVGEDDVQRIYRSNFVPGLKFDINGDGVVDDQDYLLALEYVGTICVDAPSPGPLLVHLDASNTASYPGEGDVWYDLSGRDNHFQLYGSPSQRSFEKDGGGSMYFGGSGYGELILDGDFRDTTYTYMLFTKQTPGNTGIRRRTMVGFSDSDAESGPQAYFCHNAQHWDLFTQNARILNFYSRGIGYASTSSFPAAGENFDYNSWHFVCVTVRPDSARVIINDEVFEYNGFQTDLYRKNDFDKLWLGTRFPPSNQNLLGYIANFRLYRGELSLEEISEIYNELAPTIVDT